MTDTIDKLILPSRYGPRTWRRAGFARTRGRAVLETWETACLVCGETFRVTARRNVAIENTRAFQTIACPAHRLTRVEVGQLQSHNWREILEEIRKAKLAK